jgi:hydrogenase maturation protease
LSDKSPYDDIYSPEIMILGVGCTLYSDEGFGVRVIETIQERYEGVISKPNRLIVVDAIRNKGKPGDLYRLEGEAIPERIRAKNSLHQVDFLEALTLCQALDKVPKTVIVGVEPEDIETMSIKLTPTTRAKIDAVIDMVLAELDRLGVSYDKGRSDNVSSNPISDYKD